MIKCTQTLKVLGFGCLLAQSCAADEGMWTFDNFPLQAVNGQFGLVLDQAWLDHVRLGAVRLTSGCSASLVSSEGLVLTNHHCVIECVQNFSGPGQNLVQTGFYTARREDERACPGMAAEILIAISDVTNRIANATTNAGDAYVERRDGAIASIEQECQGTADDRRCEVVSLYQGGQYKLYDYKRYNDVRLVFAPEFDAAFFGGDPDNFNFPRYAFDAAFLRLYVNNQPVATPGHLRWRNAPLVAGEPVFVAGNPGSTSRLYTTAQMAFLRDHFLPWRLQTLAELRGHLLHYSSLGAEQARIAGDLLFGVENTFKATNGERLALVDPNVFEKQARAQDALQQRVQESADLSAAVGTAWDEIAQAEADYRSFYLPLQYLETRAGGGSQLLGYARTLVRSAEERSKPGTVRLPEYADARLPGLEQQLFADVPIEAELETLVLGFWLNKAREYLGADDPRTQLLLGGENAAVLAQRLVAGSKLADREERRRLYEGGSAAIEASDDPLIQYFRRFDAEARSLRKRYEEAVEGPITLAQERIANARFAILGDTVYPDATFTLRLTYGTVTGWTEPSGREVSPFTQVSGLFARATGAPPYALAPKWEGAADRLDPDTIYNVTANTDIIGGNSGSPLLDREGQVVGAVFDGNIHSLGGDYVFDAMLNRTIAVAATAIQEGLARVYDMQHIVDELNRE